ncbi:energy-coupled thiamine transporter ThiT [Clostridium sp. LBM24168]
MHSNSKVLFIVEVALSSALATIQGLLDYPIAFTLVGLSAITSKSVHKFAKQNKKFKTLSFITLGCFIGSFARLIIHILSAMIYFGTEAPANQAIWVYAVIYNASYVLPSFVLSVAVIFVLVQARKEIIST